MPTGPSGQKRPSDAIGTAIMVAKIATGEAADNLKVKSGRVRSGKAGAAARASKLTPRQRSDIAQKAATERWRKRDRNG